MAEYRYLFCDALTGVLLEELPLTCQSYSQQINGAGSLTGTLALGGLSTVDWRSATTVNRTLAIVLRNSSPVWGGIVTKRRPTEGGATCEVTAETLEGWLSRQELQVDMPFTGADVFDIARAIITQVQSVTGGNIRLIVTAGASGQVATVTYTGTDSTKALDAINALAEVSPGFEYVVTWSRSGNVFSPTLNLAAPGLSNGLDAVLLEYPGNLVDYDYPEDGTAAPNAVTGVGDAGGGVPLLARAYDTTGQLAAGYPVTYGQVQFKTETDYGRLLARTTTAMQAGLADFVVPTAVLRGDADPAFGSFPLGIACRLRATSLYHPAGLNGIPGLDVTRRITGWTVNPSAATESVNLAMASTTGKVTVPASQRSIGDYLADLDRRVRELATRA